MEKGKLQPEIMLQYHLNIIPTTSMPPTSRIMHIHATLEGSGSLRPGAALENP